MTGAAEIEPGRTGTVLLERVDAEAVITRDLEADRERSKRAIEEYAEAYRDEEPVPPIDVFLVDGRIVVVDGFHRVMARARLGSTGVVARCVGEGSLEEAMIYALRNTNRAHGLRLSPEDCRRRVFQALDSGLWDQASARVLGRDLGISHPTARKYMKEWERRQREKGESGLPKTIVDSAGREQPRHRGSASTSSESQEQLATDEEVEELREAGLPVTERPTRGEAREILERVRAAGSTSSPNADDRPKTAEPMPDDAAVLEEIRAHFRRGRLLARQAFAGEGPRTSLRQRIEDHAERAEQACDYATAVVCPRCDGAGCEPCGGRGWAMKGTLCK